MSSLLKTNIDITESSLNLDKILNFNKKNDISATSDYNSIQLGGVNLSATSSAMMSKTKSNTKINNGDINNLLSMLTTESSVNTTSKHLENKLQRILEGGNDTDKIHDTEEIEEKMNKIINQNAGDGFSLGALAIAGLAGTALGTYAQQLYTESEINAESIIGNKPKVHNVIIGTVDKTIQQVHDIFMNNKNIKEKILTESTTDDNSPILSTESIKPKSNPQNGAGILQDGGENAGLKIFHKISKLVSDTLQIPNGKQTKVIAGQLNRDIKEINPNLQGDELYNEVKKHLEKNINKYKKMIS
jgi:predicted phage tail protein